jgi:hypothetical protein
MTTIADDSLEKIAAMTAMVGESTADAEIRKAKAALWRCLGYSGALVAAGAGIGLAFFGYSFIPAVVIHDPPAPAAPPAIPAQAQDRRASDRASDARPSQGQLQPQALPASKAKVITNFVIFKTVPVSENGEVQSGWRYEDSNQPLPSFQFCNFVQRSPNGLDTLVKLGVDGHMELPKTKLRGVDLEAVSANCVWHPNVKAASAK